MLQLCYNLLLVVHYNKCYMLQLCYKLLLVVHYSKCYMLQLCYKLMLVLHYNKCYMLQLCYNILLVLHYSKCYMLQLCYNLLFSINNNCQNLTSLSVPYKHVVLYTFLTIAYALHPSYFRFKRKQVIANIFTTKI